MAPTFEFRWLSSVASRFRYQRVSTILIDYYNYKLYYSLQSGILFIIYIIFALGYYSPGFGPYGETREPLFLVTVNLDDPLEEMWDPKNLKCTH